MGYEYAVREMSASTASDGRRQRTSQEVLSENEKDAGADAGAGDLIIYRWTNGNNTT